MNINSRLKQINADIAVVLEKANTNLIDELRALKREITNLITDEDSQFITEIKAKSVRVRKERDGKERRLMTEDFEVTSIGFTIKKDVEVVINGSIVTPIENKVIAVPKDIPEYEIEEPVVLDILLTLTPNNSIVVNGVKVLYTRVSNGMNPMSIISDAYHSYTLDNEIDLVTAMFKYDHILLMVNHGNIKQLSPEMDLIVKSLDLTEKERNRIAREKNPGYYQIVDDYYAGEKERNKYPELDTHLDISKVNTTWYKRFLNYFK